MQTLAGKIIERELKPMDRSEPVIDGEALVQAEIRKTNLAIASQRVEALANDVFRRAAIPPRFANRRLANFEPHCEGAALALRTAQAYADDFDEVLRMGRSLIFVGDVGAGKTHLATGIAHAVMERGCGALFSSVIGAVRSVKETYRRDSTTSETTAIMALIKPDLLILDEVGVQFGTDAEKLILFEIINGRYEHMRPTIVISNLAMDGLKAYLGDRIIDRLREGGGRQVVFDWDSYRRDAV